MKGIWDESVRKSIEHLNTVNIKCPHSNPNKSRALALENSFILRYLQL